MRAIGMFDVVDEPSFGVATRTVTASVTVDGTGLHGGRPARLVIRPAPAGAGILFRRVDLLAGGGADGQASALERCTVEASPVAVTQTTLGTVLSNRHGTTVATVEHLMAAFAGLGIDQAIVEIDGPEVPIMDGSAAPFIEAILAVGVRSLPAPRHFLRLIRPVRTVLGDSVIEATPREDGAQALSMAVTVDYAEVAIGTQRLALADAHGLFAEDLATARTFCRLEDVEAMRARGLALGGSLDNAIVVSGDRILNEGGLRIDGEFVRHKALDLVGDLHLLGAPLAADLVATRPGHTLNTRFARDVLDSGAAEWELAYDAAADIRLHA